MAAIVDEGVGAVDGPEPAQPVKQSKHRTGLSAWLHPPKPDENGSMELLDHLRELRYRFLVSIVAWFAISICCFVFYEKLIGVATWPITQAIEQYKFTHPDAHVQLTTQGVTGGMTLWMKVPFIAGFIISCPIWLFQLWRFIVPGLLANERKLALRFLGSSIPLFLMGIGVGYWVCPKGFSAMLTFNPPGVLNLNDLNQYLTFEIRLLLIFGLSFLLPVVLVSANQLGLIKGKQLGKFRNIAIFLCFVFAAVATPSTDPFSMCALSVPMALMYVISEVIARRHDHAIEEKRAAGEIV